MKSVVQNICALLGNLCVLRVLTFFNIPNSQLVDTVFYNDNNRKWQFFPIVHFNHEFNRGNSIIMQQ